MKYNEFAEKLKTIPSSFEIYKSLDLSDDFIKDHLRGFDLKKREGATPLFDDEILKLIANYDLSKTEIGMISFFSEPYREGQKVIIGEFEVDPLVISELTGEIECYEYGTDFCMAKCAKNSQCFLDAIYEANCFLEKRSLNDDIWENEALAEDVAIYCAELAGGSEYQSFYLTMLS